MLLKNPHLQFELQIAGYEFIDNPLDEYDYNWLQITVSIQGFEQAWQCTAASLLTWEVQKLINWLQTIEKELHNPIPYNLNDDWDYPVFHDTDNFEASDYNVLEFTESDIAFEKWDAQDDHLDSNLPHCCLKIILNKSLQPEWAQAQNKYQPLTIELEVNTEQLLEATQSLQSQLNKFPPRKPNFL